MSWNRPAALAVTGSAVWVKSLNASEWLPSPLFGVHTLSSIVPTENRIYRWPFIRPSAGNVIELGVMATQAPASSDAVFSMAVYRPDDGLIIGNSVTVTVGTGVVGPRAVTGSCMLPVFGPFELLVTCTAANSVQLVGGIDNQGIVLPGWGVSTDEREEIAALVGSAFPRYATGSTLPRQIDDIAWLTDTSARTGLYWPLVGVAA